MAKKTFKQGFQESRQDIRDLYQEFIGAKRKDRIVFILVLLLCAAFVVTFGRNGVFWDRINDGTINRIIRGN